MHVLIVGTQRCKTVTLCCEILSQSRDASVSDEHPPAVAFSPRSPGPFAGHAYANQQARSHLTSPDRLRLKKVSR